MNVVVDGLLTNYLDSKKNSKVILAIHGWADDSKTFSALSQKLASNYRFIAVDLPGFGATQAPVGVWGLSEYASFIRSFLKKIGVEPYAVLAHSNGGAVAIKAESLKNIAPKKLVLISSAGIRDKQKLKKLATKAVAKTGKIAVFWLPSTTKKKLQKKLYGAVGSDMLIKPELAETFKKTVKEDIQNDAKKVRVPTLLIYGDDDKATPQIYGKIFNELIPGSRLEIITGSHFIHQESPDRVADLIERFLK